MLSGAVLWLDFIRTATCEREDLEEKKERVRGGQSTINTMVTVFHVM